jgi:apolipoprotein D and lipocalin family protein
MNPSLTALRHARWAFALLLPALLPACRTAAPPAKPSAPLPVVARVDLNRYGGSWHEISRLPNFFQKSCVRSTAEYTPLPDGTVRVRNTCYKAKGRTSGITGTAVPVEGSGNAKLKVKFGGFAALAPVPEEGNYWIIALDPQYRWAMVGTPDRKYLWILARQPNLPFEVYRKLKQQAEALGFDTGKLLPEDAAPPGLADLRKNLKSGS